MGLHIQEPSIISQMKSILVRYRQSRATGSELQLEHLLSDSVITMPELYKKATRVLASNGCTLPIKGIKLEDKSVAETKQLTATMLLVCPTCGTEHKEIVVEDGTSWGASWRPLAPKTWAKERGCKECEPKKEAQEIINILEENSKVRALVVNYIKTGVMELENREPFCNELGAVISFRERSRHHNIYHCSAHGSFEAGFRAVVPKCPQCSAYPTNNEDLEKAYKSMRRADPELSQIETHKKLKQILWPLYKKDSGKLNKMPPEVADALRRLFKNPMQDEINVYPVLAFSEQCTTQEELEMLAAKEAPKGVDSFRWQLLKDKGAALALSNRAVVGIALNSGYPWLVSMKDFVVVPAKR